MEFDDHDRFPFEFKVDTWKTIQQDLKQKESSWLTIDHLAHDTDSSTFLRKYIEEHFDPQQARVAFTFIVGKGYQKSLRDIKDKHMFSDPKSMQEEGEILIYDKPTEVST
jgi:hypothetical protein